MISAASTPKSVLITGANSGLGLECARQLALLNVDRIVIGCRSQAKGTKAQEELKAALGGKQSKTKFEVLLMDLTDIASVRKAVQTLRTPVESLVMNAGGLGGGNPGNLTKDGVSMTVATNLLGHVAVACLRMPNTKSPLCNDSMFERTCSAAGPLPSSLQPQASSAQMTCR